VKTLTSETHDVATLEEIIQNAQIIANEKQKIILDKILDFSRNLISKIN
jgi:hypothetical protein